MATSNPRSDNQIQLSKKKTFSPVWGFFGFKPGTEDRSSPTRKLCGKQISAKAGNTSNLFSHLKNKHPRQYDESRECSQAQTRKGTGGPGSQQLGLKKSFENGQSYSRSSKRWQALTDSVTYAIAKDMLPFNVVESQGVRQMLKCFDPKYELPSRKFFSKTGIPFLYNDVKGKVENELNDVKFFSATTDMWSSEVMHPYMSLSIHFISENWGLKNYCLQTSFFPEDHTGANIAVALEGALDNWNLKKDQLVCLTTDSGSNIVSATSQLGWPRLSCFGHNLNLAVTKSLKNDARISRARKTVSSFSLSWKRRRELGIQQVEKNIPQHSLISDCPTRWGSMEAMIKRLLEQEEAVRTVLTGDRKTVHLILSWQDIDVLQSILKAITPVSDLTDLLSGEHHITISAVLPVLHNLKTKILIINEDDTTLTKDIKKSILDDLLPRYACSEIQEMLSVGTFLDPRFKLDFCESEEQSTLQEEILKIALQVYEHSPTPNFETPAIGSPPVNSLSKPIPKKRS